MICLFVFHKEKKKKSNFEGLATDDMILLNNRSLKFHKKCEF